MDPADGGEPGAVRARSLRGLIGVLSADFAALSANRLLSIAVPWFVLTTTGSATKTGLIAFCQITPFVIAQALSGPLIDRIGPRRIAIAGDLDHLSGGDEPGCGRRQAAAPRFRAPAA
jgi:MFS family permease